MAKQQRYEFTVNWLAEQAFKNTVVKRSKASYTAAALEEQKHYETMRQDSLAYQEMEHGER